ncbi:MAG: DUF4097 family beta strand repeat-containing protein [Eubacteriales bacterium]|nr:DUF4097 family beta strand repeat-containing protein [Eubacteriales bacterium]MDD4475692.1 DUF4097 family beta strand repeat-containing protein [Eubacteriales bacterium]
MDNTTVAIIKIVAFSLIALILIGILIAVLIFNKWFPFSINIGSFVGGYTYADSELYSMGNAEISLEGIRKLEIDWVSGSVEVKSGTGNKITIYETDSESLDDEYKLRYLVKDGTLYIRFIAPQNISVKLPASHTKRLTVTLPESIQKLDNFTLNTVSADCNITGISSDKVKANSVSGTISAELIDKASSFQGGTTSGEMFLSLDSEKVKLNTVSGNITVEGELVEVDAESVSGEITINSEGKPSEIDVNTVSGDVVITMPEDTGFNAKLGTVSGDLNCNFPVTTSKKNNITHGDGACDIDIDTVSGDLSIRKK